MVVNIGPVGGCGLLGLAMIGDGGLSFRSAHTEAGVARLAVVSDDGITRTFGWRSTGPRADIFAGGSPAQRESSLLSHPLIKLALLSLHSFIANGAAIATAAVAAPAVCATIYAPLAATAVSHT